MNTSKVSTLKVLSSIIAEGIDAIESGCNAQGHLYPTLDDPYDLESNKVQNKYTAEAATVIAAAYQLIATLSNPDPYLFTWGLTVCFRSSRYRTAYERLTLLRESFISSSVAVASEGCVPDILREAEPNVSCFLWS